LQIYKCIIFNKKKKHRILSRNFSNINDDFAKKGFFADGLFYYCRHPNYFGELGQWWVIYSFSCIGNKNTLNPLNWSIIGILNLCFIFYKSIQLTEDLSTFKYPNYKYYADVTSKIIPWYPKRIIKKPKQQ